MSKHPRTTPGPGEALPGLDLAADIGALIAGYRGESVKAKLSVTIEFPTRYTDGSTYSGTLCITASKGTEGLVLSEETSFIDPPGLGLDREWKDRALRHLYYEIGSELPPTVSRNEWTPIVHNLPPEDENPDFSTMDARDIMSLPQTSKNCAFFAALLMERASSFSHTRDLMPMGFKLRFLLGDSIAQSVNVPAEVFAVDQGGTVMRGHSTLAMNLSTEELASLAAAAAKHVIELKDAVERAKRLVNLWLQVPNELQ